MTFNYFDTTIRAMADGRLKTGPVLMQVWLTTEVPQKNPLVGDILGWDASNGKVAAYDEFCNTLTIAATDYGLKFSLTDPVTVTRSKLPWPVKAVVVIVKQHGWVVPFMFSEMPVMSSDVTITIVGEK